MWDYTLFTISFANENVTNQFLVQLMIVHGNLQLYNAYNKFRVRIIQNILCTEMSLSSAQMGATFSFEGTTFAAKVSSIF